MNYSDHRNRRHPQDATVMFGPNLRSNMQVDDEISFAVTQSAKKSRGRPRKRNTQ